MEDATASLRQLGMISKMLVRRLLTVGENRLELLVVELHEERERILRAFLLALGIAAFGLLAGMALSAAIVVWLWAWSPVGVLLILTALYTSAAILLYWRLTELLGNWQTLSATIEQIQKDHACLEKFLT